MEEVLIQATQIIYIVTNILIYAALMSPIVVIIWAIIEHIIQEKKMLMESENDYKNIIFIFMKRNKFGRIKIYKQDIHLSKYKISDNTKLIIRSKIQKLLIYIVWLKTAKEQNMLMPCWKEICNH